MSVVITVLKTMRDAMEKENMIVGHNDKVVL